MAPLASTRRISSIGDWKRKFSCTISGTPAARQASTMSTHSCQVGAKGFWTMVGSLWRGGGGRGGVGGGDGLQFGGGGWEEGRLWGGHLGDDVDEVEPLLLHHLGGVGVGARYAERL